MSRKSSLELTIAFISHIFMGKDSLNGKGGNAIIGFKHGLPGYVKNMALGPQSQQKSQPTASVLSTWVPRTVFLTWRGKPWLKPIISIGLADGFM